MSNKDYYALWLKVKEQIQQTLLEDQRIQELAVGFVGIKPQATAVEIVSRVYAKYCDIYNKLCDCYDQMEQVQRRPYIKKVIDALTCRIVELKTTLEEVEVFEFTYTDNACQQMLIKPQDVEILCPFFYPFETREAEMQYIMDEIFSGNRIGDPTPTASEIERQEEEAREEEERLREEREAEVKRCLALGIELVESTSIQLTPSEIEENRLREEYETQVFNIQRMERSRFIIREKTHKRIKDDNLYLELAGLAKPRAREALRIKAANMIQLYLRKYMELKRHHIREYKLKEKLGMIMSAYKPPGAKEQLEKVKETRRKFRRAYYEKWLEKNVKEKARVLKLREGDIMEDISDELRQWWTEWFNKVHVFDEFPWPDEGGSILIVKGETFTLEEYIEWKDVEEKRLKAAAGQAKTKEQIKEEKRVEREEKKRLAQEAKERELKRLEDYKKSRFNPSNDPGVYIQIGNNIEDLQFAWASYECQWKAIDEPNAGLDAIRGYLQELITENAYQDVQLQLRPIVDEVMKLELDILKNALKLDYAEVGMKPPITQKRKKPRKQKPPKPEKVPPRVMFQCLADEGIVRKYPRLTLDDFWGDRNYAAADCRAVLWTPTFPPGCVGDVREQVKIRCVLTLGATCPVINRTQLIVGPQGSGKKSLVYAVASETNALLIDLSPMNVYNKFPGPKNLKTLFTYVNRISRLMQPTIILIDRADKLFYKKIPKEEKMFDPARLSKDFFKEIIKPITMTDKILILGTASEPWLSAKPKMIKVFPNTIMLPNTDYGSISFILTKMLMEYHGIDREFNVHSVAQTLRGFNIEGIKAAVRELVSGKRLAELKCKPLQPIEILFGVMSNKKTVYLDDWDYDLFTNWYRGYSPWGTKYEDYMLMLQSQLVYKLKADKKKKG